MPNPPASPSGGREAAYTAGDLVEIANIIAAVRQYPSVEACARAVIPAVQRLLLDTAQPAPAGAGSEDVWPRVVALLESVRDNNADEMVADGVTCDMAWGEEAGALLAARRAHQR